MNFVKGKEGKGSKELKTFYLNGAVIGHVDHGKTTFTSAITRAAVEFYPEHNSSFVPYDKIDNAPEEKARGITINATHVLIGFDDREVSLVDCPGHVDYINNMISGSSKSLFAILVISAIDGVSAQTIAHVTLASSLGINKMFVVYNKMDTAEAKELIDLVEEEASELLKKNNVEMVGSIRISAFKAAAGSNADLIEIKKILDYMRDFSLSKISENEEFKMSIEAVYAPKGQGTIVTGRILSGKCTKGMEVDIVGMGMPKSSGAITNMQTFRQDVPEGLVGMDLGLQIRGIDRDKVCRGMMIVAKGKSTLATTFEAVYRIDDDPMFARKTGFGVGFEPQCFIKNVGVNITGVVKEIKGAEYAQPGDTATIVMSLMKPVMIFKDDQVIIRESNKTVARGKITRIIS